MLESSGDLRVVQELLSHANLTTTQIYTHLDFQHLAKVYDAAHPHVPNGGNPDVFLPSATPAGRADIRDLDDTLLYDNRQAIRQTEQQSLAFLQNYYPRLSRFQSTDLHRLRQ